jgi:hypothetical protein
MPTPSLTDLPTASQEAIESAGYRLARWQAARLVLEHRLAKKRLPEQLQSWLEKWLPKLEMPADSLEVRFEGHEGEMWLAEGGLASFASERALLHLPALRSFWTQELRQAHFEALRQIVPQAWFADEAWIPPGAVIAGLATADWAKASGLLRNENLFLRLKEASWAARALFHRDAKNQIVLRDWQALP